ncbi:hypothetical protein CMI47_19510 [Candidatus Pacearchaeota archaeon]|nr:hypothetical protein [Candidatus Pacearchaeota archaeon]|tara:strand:- start:3540 stop:3914 length:375 start_codon:yes stop_codon:yes gene_type:complete
MTKEEKFRPLSFAVFVSNIFRYRRYVMDSERSFWLDEYSYDDNDDGVYYMYAESDDVCMPCHVLSGSGWGWFLDVDTNQMVKMMRGSEITPVICEMDEHNRVLVRAFSRYILVPAIEVEVVGWN